jgi:hypothetical protein
MAQSVGFGGCCCGDFPTLYLFFGHPTVAFTYGPFAMTRYATGHYYQNTSANDLYGTVSWHTVSDGVSVTSEFMPKHVVFTTANVTPTGLTIRALHIGQTLARSPNFNYGQAAHVYASTSSGASSLNGLGHTPPGGINFSGCTGVFSIFNTVPEVYSTAGGSYLWRCAGLPGGSAIADGDWQSYTPSNCVQHGVTGGVPFVQIQDTNVYIPP